MELMIAAVILVVCIYGVWHFINSGGRGNG